MALTELNSPAQAFDPARPAKTFRDGPGNALDQLPLLHQEAGRSLALSRFLARSPLACVLLMLIGAVALLWAQADGGGTLKADFGWAALVLLGVVAMTRNFILGYASSPHRVPLEQAAADLRVLLIYMGAAWGAGAFLVMPDLPAPALAFLFATLPSLCLALVLGDTKGSAAFVTPASLATAGAALLGGWPMGGPVAAAIIAAGASLIILPMLRRAMRAPIVPQALPEGPLG